nr:unnamed protein product [Haemonchus contortus]
MACLAFVTIYMCYRQQLMTVVNELDSHLMASGKSNSNGHFAENNRGGSSAVTEDSAAGSHRNGDNAEDVRKQRLQKAMRVSEEWKSAMAKPRTAAATVVKPETERRRPTLTVHKFKQQTESALSTELSVASDSKICSVISDIIFLLHEADLIKENILYKCGKLKEDFEREETVVRTMLAEANIPTAISDSLLDSHFTMSSTRSAAPVQEPPHQTLSPRPGVDSVMANAVPPPFPPTNVPPPPINASVPPPGPPAFPTLHASASLPDLSVPPPPINNVTTSAHPTPPPTLPPPLTTTASSTPMFTVPPPQIPVSSGMESLPGGKSTSMTPSVPPPTLPPPSNLPPPSTVPPPSTSVLPSSTLPPPTSLPPPPILSPPSAGLPPPSSLHPPPTGSEFTNRPQPGSTGGVSVETILNASLRPCSTLQFSGPFGPPIAPPPRNDYPPPAASRGSFQGTRRFEPPNRGTFYPQRRYEGRDRRPPYQDLVSATVNSSLFSAIVF